LLGFTPRADEQKSNGSPRAAQIGLCRFSEIFDGERMRIHPAYTDTQRSRQGLWSEKMFEGLGLTMAITPPDALKADIAIRGSTYGFEQRYSKIAGGRRDLCLAGGLFFTRC